MIKFKYFLLLGLMLLIPAIASAGLSDVRFNPDPTQIQGSLSKISLQFMDANYGISRNVDTSGITLTKKSGTDVLYALPDPATNYAYLYLEFAYKGDTEPFTITEDGVYTLHVPAGAVTSLGNNAQPNDEINVDFTVQASVGTPMTAYVLTPEPGKVEAISTIDICFPDSKGLDWFYNDLFGKGNFSAITLSENGSDVKYTAIKKKFDNNSTVTLGFTDADNNEVEITAPGKYTLDIPAGMFQKDYTTTKNEQITATYTIEAPMPAEFSGMIAVPADGSIVGQLESLSMQFPGMNAGLAYPLPDVSRISVSTPDGNVYYGFNPVLKGENGVYNTVILNFAPAGAYSADDAITFTAAGEYVINVGAGALKAEGTDSYNPDFEIRFTVDPAYNFTYSLSPESGYVSDVFSPITITRGASLRSIALVDNSGKVATLSDGETVYAMTVTDTQAESLTFTPSEEAVPTVGEWTVTFPAGMFKGVNNDGLTITNIYDITSKYIIRKAERFQYTLVPEAGSTIEFFKNATVTFEGANLKQVAIATEAGTPTIASHAESYPLAATIGPSGKDVIFAINGGASLADGKYTVEIPAGYLLTIDRDNLVDRVDAIRFDVTVKAVPGTDYTQGILFLNEGWFGHDSGSLNFLSNAGEWTYDAFLRTNPERSLGLTSQYGECFGEDIYIVSKDAAEFNGKEAGQLVVADAATLKFKKQLYQVPDEECQARAFCAWDEHKGYLSTDSHIYTVDLDNMEVTGVVPGTDIYTSFNSNGEMLRYGDRIFAVRQSTGIDVIDPRTDDVTTIPVEIADALVVLPDGSLIVATRNESNEFVKISSVAPYAIEKLYDIDESKAKISSVWNKAWRKAPIAVSTTENKVYYVTLAEEEANADGARRVACYDFDTETFTPDFIKLPGVAEGENAHWILYGEGVSVDPATGRILLTAVEAGYGTHYMQNKIFVADPATGKIDMDASYTLKPNYWFPAMTMYPDFSAPTIEVSKISLLEGPAEFTVDLAAATSLRVGNKHLVNYSVGALTPDLCEVIASEIPGVFNVKVSDTGIYSLELKAEFKGKVTCQTISSENASLDAVSKDETECYDVYNQVGVCVLRNATDSDLNTLAPGIYVAKGRKIYIR